MKFEHVNATDSNAIFKRFTGAPVKENRFAVVGQAGKINGGENVGFACAVENGSGNVQTGVWRKRQAVFFNVKAKGVESVDKGIIIAFNVGELVESVGEEEKISQREQEFGKGIAFSTSSEFARKIFVFEVLKKLELHGEIF